jgi:hypothetical protein
MSGAARLSFFGRPRANVVSAVIVPESRKRAKQHRACPGKQQLKKALIERVYEG